MRLLHVFPGFDIGGVQLRIASIMNRFAGRYDHTIVSLDGSFDCRDRIDPSLGVELVDPGTKGRGAVGVVLAARRVISKVRPDILLTYNWGAMEWAAANTLLGLAPHIHLESGFGAEEAARQIPRRVWARRLALRRMRWLVVPSRTLDRIAREVWRIDPAKIRLIPNGVDCDRFEAPPDPSAVPGLARRGGELIVGTVAPLRPEKNIGRLIRAVARLDGEQTVRLLIVGDGGERRRLEQEAQAAGVADRVVFAGYAPAPEKLLGLMDVYALPSDTEQMPNTLIQAMAAGRPVAAMDVGDVAVILGEENRRFVSSAGDDAGFAAALGALLADSGLRRAVGDHNRARVRAEYHQDRMFAAYRELFDGFA